VVDEPTTGQDYQAITNIMCLLCDLQRQGKTILIITHDMTLVAEYCQRVVSFRNGLVTFNGSPAELFSDPDLLVQTGLRAPPVLHWRISSRNPTRTPTLLTVSHWVDALAQQLQPEMKNRIEYVLKKKECAMAQSHIAIIADVHANIWALDAVLKDIRQRG